MLILSMFRYRQLFRQKIVKLFPLLPRHEESDLAYVAPTRADTSHVSIRGKQGIPRFRGENATHQLMHIFAEQDKNSCMQFILRAEQLKYHSDGVTDLFSARESRLEAHRALLRIAETPIVSLDRPRPRVS